VARGHQVGLLPLLLALDDLDARLLARQRAVDEHDDALAVVRDALRVEVDAGDLQPFVVGHTRCRARVALPPLPTAATAALACRRACGARTLLFAAHAVIIDGPKSSAPDRSCEPGPNASVVGSVRA